MRIIATVKGITIKLGADVTPLQKGIRSLNTETNSLQRELRGVETLLKLDPKNIDLLRQQQELLARAVGETKNKLEILRDTKIKVDSDMASGTEVNVKEYRNLEREIAHTESSLKKLEKTISTTNSSWQDSADKLGKFGDKAVDVGGTLTKGVTLPIAAAGTAAYMFAADLEDAFGATEQIYKGSADEVKAWADTLKSYYGIAEKDALEYANVMGAMLQNIGGLSAAEAAKQGQILVELAGDLAAMFGGTTESAITALTGALKGNTTMLDNYGMGVNQATIKTKALEMGLHSGTGEMTLQIKQAATLALIMEQTADAQGQAAREAEGASGAMRALKTELKNLATDIGQLLLPVITPLVNKLREMAEKLSAMSPETQRMVVLFLALAAAIGPVLIIVGKLAFALKSLIELKLILTPLIAGLGTSSGIAAVGVGALGTAAAFLGLPLWGLVAIIGAVIAAITLLYKKFKKGKDDIVDESKDMADEVKTIMDKINNPDSLYDPYLNIGKDINLGLVDGINSNGELPLNAVDEQSKALADKVKENISKMDTFGAAITTALTNQYKEMQEEQVTMLDTKVKNEKNASEKIISLIKQSTETEKVALNDRLAKLKVSTDERISEYQRDYNNRMLYLNTDTTTTVDDIQAKIDAIDKVAKKESQALKTREYNEQLSALSMQRLMAKSSEEQKAIMEKYQQVKKQRDEEIAANTREVNKNKLKEQMEQVKKEAAIQEKKLKDELDKKKEAEKKKQEEQEKSIKTELEQLQKTSDSKILVEQERIKKRMLLLDTEKEAMKKHFDNLLSQENIEAEARELVVKGNNDKIIKLLATYNPKWQNAGQSFGDSIINGLNSKKDSMHKAINDLMKIPNIKINGEVSIAAVNKGMSSVAQPNPINNNQARDDAYAKKITTDLSSISKSLQTLNSAEDTRTLKNILTTLGSTQKEAIFKIGDAEFGRAVINSIRKQEKRTGRPLLL